MRLSFVIKSTFVKTPTVRNPFSSTLLASAIAAESAISTLASDTASMITLSRSINFRTKFSIWSFISTGCSGKLLRTKPGKSKGRNVSMSKNNREERP